AAASGPERRGLPESLDEVRRELGPRDPADTVRTEVAAPHGARSYLFENCGALRALCRPAFLRSTMRASRVRKPCRLRGILISGSASTSARAMPCLIAPAWPEGPPPCTRTRRSYVAAASATSSGASTIWRCTARGKYSSSVRPLIQVFPSPGRRMTRATDVLRLPVPRYCAISLTGAPVASATGLRADAPARRRSLAS